VSRLQISIAQGFAQGDIRTMLGFTSMLGLGSAVYALKQVAADRPIERDPTRFAMEVVDRSGMLAWSGDIIYPALWQAGFDDLSRWSDRSPWKTLLGPSAGTIADTWGQRLPAKTLGHVGLGGNQLKESDLHKLRKLIPAQNLFYLRRAINALEENAAEVVGIPGR
jgi:hypothetical protein